MPTRIFCKANDEFQAESIVYELKAAGFPEDALSILAPSSPAAEDAGNILISVTSETNEEAQRAREIFEQAEAQDISVAVEEEARR